MSVVRIEQIGGKELDRATKILAGFGRGDMIKSAVKDAMQRSVATLRKESTNAIREKYDIAASEIRGKGSDQAITSNYHYASDGSITAIVNFSGYKIPLYRYGGSSPQQPTPDKSKKRVLVEIDGQKKLVYPGVTASGHLLKGTAPTKLDNTFVALMKSGRKGIFERTGGATAKGADAIQEVMGLSVPQMLGNKEVEEKLARKAMDKFGERLDDNVNRIISGVWG